MGAEHLGSHGGEAVLQWQRNLRPRKVDRSKRSWFQISGVVLGLSRRRSEEEDIMSEGKRRMRAVYLWREGGGRAGPRGV